MRGIIEFDCDLLKFLVNLCPSLSLSLSPRNHTFHCEILVFVFPNLHSRIFFLFPSLSLSLPLTSVVHIRVLCFYSLFRFVFVVYAILFLPLSFESSVSNHSKNRESVTELNAILRERERMRQTVHRESIIYDEAFPLSPSHSV